MALMFDVIIVYYYDTVKRMRRINMFSKRLNELRKSRGIPAQQMADYLHTSLRNYRKYESGDARPTMESLILIADYLDVSLDYLLCRDEYMERKGRTE